MAKIKTLHLSFPHAPAERDRDDILYGTGRNADADERQKLWDAARLYRVERVTDSLELSPGQYLTRQVAQSFCDNGEWKVTVTVGKE
jgi:hypothetical protein